MNKVTFEIFKLENNIEIEIFFEKANKENIIDWIKRGHQEEIINDIINYSNSQNSLNTKLLNKMEWHIKTIYELSRINKNSQFYFLKAILKQNSDELNGSDIFLGLISFVPKYLPIFCKDLRCCVFYNIIKNIDKTAFIWYIAKTDNFNKINKILQKYLSKKFDMMSIIEKFIIDNWHVELIWLRAFTESLKEVYREKGFCEVEFLDCRLNRLSVFRKVDDKYMCKTVNPELQNFLREIL